ncbi:MAG TPA: hypothetical protein VGG81_12370 [Edaphobacter sp.]
MDLSFPVLEGPEEGSAAAPAVESAVVALAAAARKADTPESYQPVEEPAPASMRVEEE